MLDEVRCDRFTDEGKPRKAIRFKPGLNAVLGAERANNSIGKTTFLLVIDFCFGGSSYSTLNGDVLDNIGDHIIEFAHKFGNETHRFSRGFLNYRMVNICDEDYRIRKSISLDEFNDWLLEKYQMPSEDCRFRDLVRGYQRIFGIKNYDEKLPLKANEGDSMENGITRLLKLYELFPETSSLDKACKTADEELKAFRAAVKHQLVIPAADKRTYESNKARIKILQFRKDELMRKDHDNLTDLEPMVAERVSTLKKDAANLKRKRTRLRSELATIEDEKSFATYKADKSMPEFRRFFPEANIRSIEEIDRFHSQLCGYLEKERKEQELSLKTEIELLSGQIDEIESQIRECGSVSNLTSVILDEYSSLDREIFQLITANDLFEKKRAIEEDCKSKKRLRDERKSLLLGSMQTDINGEIAELNTEICGPEKAAPVLNIESSKKYTYGIRNDYGTGSLTRAMVMLDLTVLKQTSLPCITHDSHLIKQIEDDAVLALLEKYDETDKQVFIAIDKGHSYSDEGMPNVLKSSIVLHLDKGHELFGKAWNVKGDKEANN